MNRLGKAPMLPKSGMDQTAFLMLPLESNPKSLKTDQSIFMICVPFHLLKEERKYQAKWKAEWKVQVWRRRSLFLGFISLRVQSACPFKCFFHFQTPLIATGRLPAEHFELFLGSNGIEICFSHCFLKTSRCTLMRLFSPPECLHPNDSAAQTIVILFLKLSVYSFGTVRA